MATLDNRYGIKDGDVLVHTDTGVRWRVVKCDEYNASGNSCNYRLEDLDGPRKIPPTLVQVDLVRTRDEKLIDRVPVRI